MGQPVEGDPAKAVVPGADLQEAFMVAQRAMSVGELEQAAIQFGTACVSAQIALTKGVEKGMVEFTEELQVHCRAYIWQCALHRALCFGMVPGDKQLAESLKCLQDMVKIGEDLGDPMKTGEALGLVAAMQLRTGQAADVLGTVAKLLKHARDHALRDYEQMALAHQGTALAALGKADQAVVALRKAQTMAAELGDKRAEGDACVSLAKASVAAGDNAGARAAAERAVGLAEEEEDVQRVEQMHAKLAEELAFAA